MNLLDRYIARQFLVNILTLFAILFAIIIAVDFSLNFDEFSEKAPRLLADWHWSENGATRLLAAVALVLDLWWPRLFQLFNYMVGLMMVGGMGFTCAQMVKHREFVAILAGGVSLHRIARPLVIVGIIMTVLQVANTEYMLPRLAPLLMRDKKQAGERSLGVQSLPLIVDASGRLWYARRFDASTGDLQGLWIWERDENGLLTRRITADGAHFEAGAWVLQHGVADLRRGSNDQIETMAPQAVQRIETDLDPTALRIKRFQGYSQNLSTSQVTELMRRLEKQPQPSENQLDSLARIRFGRIAGAACNVLTLLICMPFFVRREPGNMVAKSLMAAPVALGSLVGGLLVTTAALPGLPPELGVFVPVMVLLPLSIAAVTSIRS
ncbi:MAG: LptF/LptG family permease [Tepidisphaera sp.]|nr:LptF/LptG family permease [Tepidisphaera sp.]